MKKTKAKQAEVDLLSKWNNVPKFAGKYGKVKPAKPAQKVEQSTGFLPAKFVPGVGAKKQAMQYTGDKMIGVAVMHKSCLQPVFNQQQAVESATMRRG